MSRSRGPPRLLCTATQQKNGPGSEEEAEKPEQTSADRVLLEEKSQLETQLKDLTVRGRPGPKQSRRAFWLTGLLMLAGEVQACSG